MPFEQTSDPDVIRKRSGGGCLAILGLPFLLAGLALALASLGLFPGKHPPPWLVGLPFGGVFAAVGVALITGRGGVSLDRRSREVTTWWSCLGFGKRKPRPLEGIRRVTLAREVRRSDKSTYTVYPVRLQADEGKPVDLDEPRDFQEARATAEQIAKHLGLAIVDTTSGAEVTRAADELDLSLREQIKRSGDRTAVPDPPADTRIRFAIEGAELTLDLPPKGLGARHVWMLVGLAVSAVIAAAFMVGVLMREKTPPGVRIVMGCVMGVLFVGVPALAVFAKILSDARVHTRVIASLKRLRVEKHGLLRRQVTEIPADDLEELEAPDHAALPPEAAKLSGFARKMAIAMARRSRKGIQARSDQASVEFGQDLSDEEQAWVCAILRHMLSA